MVRLLICTLAALPYRLLLVALQIIIRWSIVYYTWSGVRDYSQSCSHDPLEDWQSFIQSQRCRKLCETFAIPLGVPRFWWRSRLERSRKSRRVVKVQDSDCKYPDAIEPVQLE
jgi:hypothetical protein